MSQNLSAHTLRLIERTCTKRPHLKLTVGLLESGESSIRIFSEAGEQEPYDHIYEIGSLGKVFVATLLAKYVGLGEVSLTESVGNYLPGLDPTRYYPTFLRLATHRSGYGGRLPLTRRQFAHLILDMALSRNQGEVPFTLNGDQFTQLIRTTQLEDEDYPWAYSNFAYAILGHALGSICGLGFEQGMTQFVSHDLGLPNTFIGTGEQSLCGYTAKNQPVGNWDFTNNWMAPAGALSSTATDLLAFAQQNIDQSQPYFSMCHYAYAQISKHYDMGLGWWLDKADHRILHHEGGTGCYGSFLIIDRGTGRACVVLSNYRLGMTSEKSIALSVMSR